MSIKFTRISREKYRRGPCKGRFLHMRRGDFHNEHITAEVVEYADDRHYLAHVFTLDEFDHAEKSVSFRQCTKKALLTQLNSLRWIEGKLCWIGAAPKPVGTFGW